jgi:signal transduction histidine kinase
MKQKRSKYRSLLDIIFKMTEAQDIDKILKILLDGALELVGAKHGSIFKLDYPTGKIVNTHSLPSQISSLQEIPWGQGIVGKALKEKRTVIVKDNNLPQWKGIYLKSWDKMRSEISIPIVLENIPVRIETRIETGTKRIGVLSIEHIKINYFSEADGVLLKNLTRYAAIRIEDVDSNLKLTQLRTKEREISEESKDYKQIIDLVTDSIIEILQFNDIVHISLVNLEQRTIESKYIKGLPVDRLEDFKKRAVHGLDSDDIQADLIRKRQIEVPCADDDRLDRELANDFDHDKLVRVFIPMIEAANDQAIGTVECGYQKEYREYIYERDVQILESFVHQAVQALEKRKKDWLEIVTHELRNPILGIRNHADILSRRWRDLRDDVVTAKLDDILTDTEILFYQVRQLEVTMGSRRTSKITIESVSIYNEIIKVTKQLKPLLRDRDFSYDSINYKFIDRTRYMEIKTDRVRLNQIFYNLLINSIKYSERDPEKFRVDIKVEKIPNENYFKIIFRDYGIGIQEDEQNMIFQYGFRSGKARRTEQGSGMGLSISRDLITRLGGKLILNRCRHPTEFEVIICDYPDTDCI